MLTLTELIAEVKDLCGRQGDTVLVTDARVVRFLNEAQDEIVRICTGHIDLETKKVDALLLVSGTYAYDFSVVTPAVVHLLNVFYMDEHQSRKLLYRDTDYFDKKRPDPSLYDGIPTEWTRRSGQIELYPVPTSSEAGKYLRLNYTRQPTSFSLAAATGTCLMSSADKGLIYYALAEAWSIIGQADNEVEKYKILFAKWLEEYRLDKDGRNLSEMNELF